MMKIGGPEWEGITNHWFTYIAVDDVDATAAKVGPAGGEVKWPPHDIPDVGRIAIIADPTGAVIGIFKPASA